MIVRHSIARWLMAGLLLTLSAACGASSVPSPTPVVPVGANITLVLWHGWSGTAGQALSSLIDEFNRQHPEGRVLAQSMPLSTLSGDLRMATAAGTGPHLALLPNTWVGRLARDRILIPLDDLISPAERQALLPVTLNGAQAPDAEGRQRLYGLPISFDTQALFYNRDNIQVAPQTTDTLFQVARGLSAPHENPPRWGLALNLSPDMTIGYLYAFGGRLFDQQGVLSLGTDGRMGAERWLEWLAKLNADDQLLIHPDSSLRVERELKSGHVLMTFGWAHDLAEYRRLWGQNVGIAPLPSLSETNEPPLPYVQSELLAINSRVGAAERRVALEFLRFLISAPVQEVLLAHDIQPARQELRLDGDAPQLVAARAFRAQAQRGQPMPNGLDREQIQLALRIMQQQVLTSSASPHDAVTEAEARLRAALNPPPQ